jgi:RNA polymerase sigma factor for flagellar operon FliA
MSLCPDERQAERYLPFVRKIATRIARRLPMHVDVDDLVGAGTIGLMEALDRYTPRGDRTFETYAEFRVKGAIMDELRRGDPLKRSARAMQTKIEAKRQSLAMGLGRQPEEHEVMQALSLSAAQYHRTQQQAEVCGTMPLLHEDVVEADEEGLDQEAQMLRAEQIAAVREAMGQLGAREQTILDLYYVQELTQQQIGEVLEVTESRVCQLLSQLRKKLHTRLQQVR